MGEKRTDAIRLPWTVAARARGSVTAIREGDLAEGRIVQAGEEILVRECEGIPRGTRGRVVTILDPEISPDDAVLRVAVDLPGMPLVMLRPDQLE